MAAERLPRSRPAPISARRRDSAVRPAAPSERRGPLARRTPRWRGIDHDHALQDTRSRRRGPLRRAPPDARCPTTTSGPTPRTGRRTGRPPTRRPAPARARSAARDADASRPAPAAAAVAAARCTAASRSSSVSASQHARSAPSRRVDRGDRSAAPRTRDQRNAPRTCRCRRVPRSPPRPRSRAPGCCGSSANAVRCTGHAVDQLHAADRRAPHLGNRGQHEGLVGAPTASIAASSSAPRCPRSAGVDLLQHDAVARVAGAGQRRAHRAARRVRRQRPALRVARSRAGRPRRRPPHPSGVGTTTRPGQGSSAARDVARAGQVVRDDAQRVGMPDASGQQHRARRRAVELRELERQTDEHVAPRLDAAGGRAPRSRTRRRPSRHVMHRESRCCRTARSTGSPCRRRARRARPAPARRRRVR